MGASSKAASKCFMFMYFLQPHWVPAAWRSRAQTSIRAELPSGNVPSTRVRRRTRVVGTFPDGNSALMLVCARLRHVAGTQWGNKKYMNMKHLEAVMDDASIAG